MALNGQTWTMDYIIGLLVFITAIILSVQLLTTTASNPEFDETRREADRISDTLLSAGIPEYWTNESVVRPGILADGRIDPDQVGQLLAMDYLLARRLLNIKSDFYFVFVNTTDQTSLILINASCGYGDPDVDVQITTTGGGSTECGGAPCTGSAQACSGTQTACNGTGASCTGTYGACLGTATSCGQYEEMTGDCFTPPGPQQGCFLDPDTFQCTGTPTACSAPALGTALACRRQHGCYWVTCGNYSSSEATCKTPPHNTTCSYLTCANYTQNPTSCLGLSGCAWYNCTYPTPANEAACQTRFSSGSLCSWLDCQDFNNNPGGCTSFGCTAPNCAAWSGDNATCVANGCTFTATPASGPLLGNCTLDTDTIGQDAEQLVRIDRLARYPAWDGAANVDNLLTIRLYVWD